MQRDDIGQCPTLRPTMKEFQNFREYVNRVEKQYRGDFGMVKVIPPKAWISRCQNYERKRKNISILKPEFQTLYSKAKSDYFFSCQNKRHERMTIAEYERYALEKQKDIKDFKNNYKQVQNCFWGIYNTLNNELYGANVEESLMDSRSGQWEFPHLSSFFSDIVTEKIHGLNTSFLFVGAWRTFFNWHIQDLDLSAINLLHEGAPKMWYCVHPEDRKRFQGILASLFSDKFFDCPNYLRHKQVFLNPYKLKKKYPYLRISKTCQQEGEISIAFAEGYHSGFNLGYNIAEAVNFGNEDWLDRYSRFKGCNCQLKIGVTLEHSQMIQNIRNKPELKSILSSPAFSKLQIRAEKDLKPRKLFENASEEEVEREIQKAKRKLISKNEKYVYVEKYDKYFSIEKQAYVHCEGCNKWRKTTQQKAKKFEKKNFRCQKLGFACKPASNNKNQKKSTIKKSVRISQNNKKKSLKGK